MASIPGGILCTILGVRSEPHLISIYLATTVTARDISAESTLVVDQNSELQCTHSLCSVRTAQKTTELLEIQ